MSQPNTLDHQLTDIARLCQAVCTYTQLALARSETSIGSQRHFELVEVERRVLQ